MTTQPEALRLAAALDYYRDYDMSVTHTGIDEQAADELRRLHESNQELLAALEQIETATACAFSRNISRAAIAKAERTTT